MSIQGKVNELKSIQNELTSIRKQTSGLRQRAKQLEQEIKDYLDAKDQPGLKYKGLAIIRETKPKHKTKKKADQKSDAIYVLEQHGIDDPEKVLEEILTARKGSPTEQTKLKFKKYKNKNVY
jgi:predicted RNase H-like nuclease (RuvC/YqgF family)